MKKNETLKFFNEREFLEDIENLDVSNTLQLDKYDPNFSLENMHNHITYILDEYAPFRKYAQSHHLHS